MNLDEIKNKASKVRVSDLRRSGMQASVHSMNDLIDTLKVADEAERKKATSDRKLNDLLEEIPEPQKGILEEISQELREVISRIKEQNELNTSLISQSLKLRSCWEYHKADPSTMIAVLLETFPDPIILFQARSLQESGYIAGHR